MSQTKDIYPWNYFNNCDVPNRIYYNSEEDALNCLARPSHKQFFENRSNRNGVETNEWVLELITWNPEDKMRPFGPRSLVNFNVTPKKFLWFDDKVFANIQNLLRYLVSIGQVNTALRMSFAIGPKNGVRIAVQFFTKPSCRDVRITFRNIGDGFSFGEKSHDVEHVSSTEIVPSSPESPEPSDNAPATMLQTLLIARTATVQKQLEEENAAHLAAREAIQQQIAALESEHYEKRRKLSHSIAVEAHKMREEIEKQWAELVAIYNE